MATQANDSGFDYQLVYCWPGATYPYDVGCTYGFYPYTNGSYAAASIAGQPYNYEFGTTIPFTWKKRVPVKVIARALTVVALVALVSGGCSSSPHGTAAKSTTPAERTTPASSVPASGPMCSAAQGSLVPSAPPFTNTNRLIQPFGYVNHGPPCFAEGFPVVQLYNAQHQLLSIPEVDGNIVIGTSVPARYFLQTNNAVGGFNIETPASGSSCVTASYASASFGGGTTPLASINYQVCGTLYLTPIFE